MEKRFDFQMQFSITQDGEPFCDGELNHHNMDRPRMLVLENELVELVNRINQLERPEPQ